MKTLAFDTTGPIISVGVAQDGNVQGRRDSAADRRRGNLVDQLIDNLLNEVGWTRADVGGLGLLTGPGSLTAMRLGWATAAGWAQAAGIPVAGWTVPAAHRRHLKEKSHGACCSIQYRGETFLLYDLDQPEGPPKAIELTLVARAASSPQFVTGPGIIGKSESWRHYFGSSTNIASESDAIIGGDTLALWAAEDLMQGTALSLNKSPLEYGLPPDFKKLYSA